VRETSLVETTAFKKVSSCCFNALVSEEHLVVNLEIDKAKVIQNRQVSTKLLDWLLVNLVEVDSLWSNWHHLRDDHLL
jgi:hypothetical protein